jgi:type IV pilus assembly protein PilA
VLIIAILMAIAIPTYLGARSRAQDRGAQSTARNAFVAARISYAGASQYTSDGTAMAVIEPSLAWTNADLSPAAPVHAAYVAVSPDHLTLVVGARARNGHCFFIEDIMSAPGTGTRYYGDTSGSPTCAAPAFGDSAWTSTW